jgi:hypothetical protein
MLTTSRSDVKHANVGFGLAAGGVGRSTRAGVDSATALRSARNDCFCASIRAE